MFSILAAAFITGLTAGGLSCFAVQGGLLSGSFARQMETLPIKKGTNKTNQSTITNKSMVLSVLLFLAAKLFAYTLLGLGLGWLGSIFYLSPMLKGMLQIGIGIFLVGNALRMFNIHPIFRFFSFEPPSQFTRFIRKISRGNDRYSTPLFLGALTILIPCGVTQSAMAVAMGTGSPWLGAAVMFTFILGTSPTFFGVTVLATGLAKVFQKYFYPIVAVIVLGLGLYTVDGGLNLVGSPLSSSAIVASLASGPQSDAGQNAQGPAASSATSNVVMVAAANSGYSPARTTASAGKPIQLILTTKDTYSCSRSFVIPSLGIQKLLPATGQTVIDLPAQAAGTSLRFTCSMGMYNGVILFQ
jgi:sulfite exporter TauE/SafE